MPLLSVIRRGREQAKEQKEKDGAKIKGEALKVPYKHIPTHAAIDAMSGAPNTFKDLDRAKILEQHRRRSAMSINRTGSRNMHRLGSSLSVVSYPSPQTIPVVSRTGSSNSMPIHPRMRASIGATYASYSSHSKGKGRGAVPSLSSGVAIPMLASDQRDMFGVKDAGENSSVSDDDLEMKNLTRPSNNQPPHFVEERSSISKQNPTNNENTDKLYPPHQQKGRRQTPGGRSGRNLPQITRTRFTEPKPMDLHVFGDGLGRGSSTATLDSAQNGESYASSSTSETVPISTAPTSLTSTPDPSTVVVTNFPPAVEIPHSTPRSTSEFPTTTSSSETSEDTPEEALDEPIKEPGSLLNVAPWLEDPMVTAPTITLYESGKVEQAQPHPVDTTLTPLKKPSKNSRWSWRRTKLATGEKLVVSH